MKSERLRCDRTGNPAGTDTEMIGQPCDCQGCRATKRIAELEAVIERDRTKAAEILEGIERALAGHEWLRLGRGSYEYDDDRWKDEFAVCFDNIKAALKPLAILAGDLANCPKTWTEIQRARKGRSPREVMLAVLGDCNAPLVDDLLERLANNDAPIATGATPPQRRAGDA